MNNRMPLTTRVMSQQDARQIDALDREREERERERERETGEQQVEEAYEEGDEEEDSEDHHGHYDEDSEHRHDVRQENHHEAHHHSHHGNGHDEQCQGEHDGRHENDRAASHNEDQQGQGEMYADSYINGDMEGYAGAYAEAQVQGYAQEDVQQPQMLEGQGQLEYAHPVEGHVAYDQQLEGGVIGEGVEYEYYEGGEEAIGGEVEMVEHEEAGYDYGECDGEIGFEGGYAVEGELDCPGDFGGYE